MNSSIRRILLAFCLTFAACGGSSGKGGSDQAGASAGNGGGGISNSGGTGGSDTVAREFLATSGSWLGKSVYFAVNGTGNITNFTCPVAPNSLLSYDRSFVLVADDNTFSFSHESDPLSASANGTVSDMHVSGHFDTLNHGTVTIRSKSATWTEDVAPVDPCQVKALQLTLTDMTNTAATISLREVLSGESVNVRASVTVVRPEECKSFPGGVVTFAVSDPDGTGSTLDQTQATVGGGSASVARVKLVAGARPGNILITTSIDGGTSGTVSAQRSLEVINPCEPMAVKLTAATSTVAPGKSTTLTANVIPLYESTCPAGVADGTPVTFTMAGTSDSTLSVASAQTIGGAATTEFKAGSIGGTITIYAKQGTASASTTIKVGRAFPMIGEIAIPSATSMVLGAGYLYLGSGSKGLSVVDITNPAAPGIVASLTTVDVGGFAMQGTLGFAVSMSAGLKIIDLSVPTEPKLVGEVAGATGYGVGVDGTTVVTSGGYLNPKYLGLSVVDVTTPNAPKLLAQMSNVWGSNVIVRGKAVYLGRSYSATAYNDASLCKSAACTIDLAQPAAPAFVASLDSRYGADGMFMAAGRLHVARRGELIRYNLEAPLAPTQYDSIAHTMGQGIGWGYGDADQRGVVMVEAASSGILGWIDFLQEDATGKLAAVDRISQLDCTEVRLARPFLYALCNVESSGKKVRIFDISAL